ncbi:MAG: NAD(P)-dependent oxidoreductase [Candidatus Bathyarchaeia archaeon]|jgi:3-hydroxyisobutyrate dehydrogenase
MDKLGNVEKNLKRLGFIGLGTMGSLMCKNLLKAGYSIVVWNRTPSKVEGIVSFGAKVAATPEEVAKRSDIVIIMVDDAADVDAVVTCPHGVIEGAGPNLIVVDMSSTSPVAARHISEILAKKNVKTLDAPVSGGEVGARDATLSIMVGGPKETYDECIPVFMALGKQVTYMGDSGSGQATKLCNQVICALNIQAICEGLALGAELGLDSERLLKVLMAGYANSRILSDLGPKMVQKDFRPGFKMRHQLKDLKNALDTATKINLPMPCTALVYQLFSVVTTMNLQEKGTQASILVMEKLAGKPLNLFGSQSQ